MTTLDRPALFSKRHIGPQDDDVAAMLQVLGVDSLDALIDEAVPAEIRLDRPLQLEAPRSEADAIEEFAELMGKNEVFRSFIGMGYYDTITPPVIQRNVLENPGWYTQYTPYQSEIAQGRLEALFVFQTVIADLTGLPLANASMLDEGTAAAEAVVMAVRANRKNKSDVFVVSDGCHPQTIEIVKTRSRHLGIEILVEDVHAFDFDREIAGVLVQYPTTRGAIEDYRRIADTVHKNNGYVIAATDLLALTLLKPPGEWGADIAVGNSQRFGVPLGFGGPHAGFMSATDDFRRQIPGRIVGQSIDRTGKPALRLALQTREQHIRRERATSNICTAQVLLAIMAGMYAVYHGPAGLTQIARRVRALTAALRSGASRLGLEVADVPTFDTVWFEGLDAKVGARARDAGVNLRIERGGVGVSLDERTKPSDIVTLLEVLSGKTVDFELDGATEDYDERYARTSLFLTNEVFHTHRSETEFLRWVHRLQSRDLSLTTSMIPLGSCTMKLNATTEMLPVTWKEVAGLHPFAPSDQTAGYRQMFERLERWLAEITGMQAVSLQPNAGSQGEYAGMLVIDAFHRSNGEEHRKICLIPESAHGTNPASAVMAGMKVVVVKCDDAGNVDLEDLRVKIDEHGQNLSSIMITYPSTHGVFERSVREICDIVHAAGGQVYLDGANMNAQVGLCRPGDYGADVVHLNLHKTFCIPHGGGGPGMGPIAVQSHLAPFLPSHPVVEGVGGESAVGVVSAAPWGSPAILPISYLYIHMLGASGLETATKVAILNANYMAKRLEGHFDVLYRGPNGRVAHEFILDLRDFKRTADVEVFDVAKRLMDYGFHAPTVSWPVPGTIMVEPTESESKQELDRFCDAMIAIHGEIEKVQAGEWGRVDNPLKNAPHPATVVIDDEWDHEYSRSVAAFPAPWTREHKFWPAVSRIDDAYGDKNLVCACPPTSAYDE